MYIYIYIKCNSLEPDFGMFTFFYVNLEGPKVLSTMNNGEQMLIIPWNWGETNLLNKAEWATVFAILE